MNSKIDEEMHDVDLAASGHEPIRSHVIDYIAALFKSSTNILNIMRIVIDPAIYIYDPQKVKPWLPPYDNGRRYRNRPKRRPRGK